MTTITSSNLSDIRLLNQIEEQSLLTPPIAECEINSFWFNVYATKYKSGTLLPKAMKQLLQSLIHACSLGENVNNLWIPIEALETFDRHLGFLGKKGHSLHSAKVFFLFWRILLALLQRPETKEDLKNYIQNIFSSYLKDEGDNAWKNWLLLGSLTTCSYHDVGYGIQEAELFSTHFADLYSDVSFNSIEKKWRCISEGYSVAGETSLWCPPGGAKNFLGDNKIDDFILSGIAKSLGWTGPGYRGKLLELEKSLQRAQKKLDGKKADDSKYDLHGNHGYISAIVLCHTFLRHLEQVEPSTPLLMKGGIKFLEDMTAAVALHHAKENDVHDNLDFRRNPLAFLLLVADSIQEWGRVLPGNNRDEKRYPSYHLIYYKANSDEKEITTELHLKYELQHNKWDDDTIEKVMEDLEILRCIFAKIQKKGPKLNPPLVIRVDYQSDIGDNFNPVELVL